MNVVLFTINQTGGRVLQCLLDRGIKVEMLITRQDSIETELSPYKIAHQVGIPFRMPDRFSDSIIREIGAINPDVVISGWFHLKIPTAIIKASKFISVNLHPSLLPMYRGATPIEWCIMNGEKHTGLTLHKLTDRFDTGDILWQKSLAILPEETAGELLERLSSMIPEAIDNLVHRIQVNDCVGILQNETTATYFPKRSIKDAEIDWNWDSVRIRNRVRGLNPIPLARINIAGCKYVVKLAIPTGESHANLMPGHVIQLNLKKRYAEVVCGDGKALRFTEIDSAI